MGYRIHFAGALLVALVYTLPGSAEPNAATSPTSKPASGSPSGLTVALLDFTTDTPGEPNLGAQISEVLTATLGGQVGYTLVDRSSLTRVLLEHELNLTGLVDGGQQIRAGKLVGAKILITGHVFVDGKQTLITVKLIGTETSRLDAMLVRGDSSAGIGPLIMQLSAQIARQLPISGPNLIAKEDATLDPVPGLKKILARKKLPTLGMRIRERHLPEAGSAHIDPAVETELKLMLVDAGFTIIDGTDSDLAKAGVQINLTGEAFSEFAAHIGNLVSCTDRVELQMTQFSDGKVLLSDRDNNRAVDLSENLAGKLALQKSARVLGVRLLQYFADNSPVR